MSGHDDLKQVVMAACLNAADKLGPAIKQMSWFGKARESVHQSKKSAA